MAFKYIVTVDTAANLESLRAAGGLINGLEYHDSTNGIRYVATAVNVLTRIEAVLKRESSVIKAVTSTDSYQLGGATNYLSVAADGWLTLEGTAMFEDDIALGATTLLQTGTGVSINTTEGTVDFLTSANSSDYLFASAQLPHGVEPGSTFVPHVHFFQSENNVPNFAFQYRYQANGGAKVTAWTAIKCNTPIKTYTSGTILQIAAVATAITPPVVYDYSDIIQIRLIRDTTNALGLSYGADPFTTTVQVVSLDIHCKFDKLGTKI